jgi:large subunit ribosomal protein L22
MCIRDSDLMVRTAFVDEGFRMKRVRPAPMGRAYRVQKRTCHVTIQLATAGGEE